MLFLCFHAQTTTNYLLSAGIGKFSTLEVDSPEWRHMQVDNFAFVSHKGEMDA